MAIQWKPKTNMCICADCVPTRAFARISQTGVIEITSWDVTIFNILFSSLSKTIDYTESWSWVFVTMKHPCKLLPPLNFNFKKRALGTYSRKYGMSIFYSSGLGMDCTISRIWLDYKQCRMIFMGVSCCPW